jgi:hypothetical protein
VLVFSKKKEKKKEKRNKNKGYLPPIFIGIFGICF